MATDIQVVEAPKKLTRRQEVFVSEYLMCWPAAACRRYWLAAGRRRGVVCVDVEALI